MPTSRKVLEMAKNFDTSKPKIQVVEPPKYKIGLTELSSDNAKLQGKPLDFNVTASNFKKNIDILIEAAEEMIERTKRY